jgi:hypothetical protein
MYAVSTWMPKLITMCSGDADSLFHVLAARHHFSTCLMRVSQ